MGRAARMRPERLGEKLLEIRQRLGLSQSEMLRRLGLDDVLDAGYVSKYERGVLEPPLPVLLAYADLANVFLEALARDDVDIPAELPAGKRHEGVRRKGAESRRR